jgi:hypothetical protein
MSEVRNDDKRLSTHDIAAAGDASARTAVQSRDQHDQVAAPDAPRTVDDSPAPLFVSEDAAGYRTRWSAIQTGFVDEPRNAVEEADALVAEVMKRLAEIFADERRQLESQWERAEQISTEDLRLAMRRYRSFFERLLSV